MALEVLSRWGLAIFQKIKGYIMIDTIKTHIQEREEAFEKWFDSFDKKYKPIQELLKMAFDAGVRYHPDDKRLQNYDDELKTNSTEKPNSSP